MRSRVWWIQRQSKVWTGGSSGGTGQKGEEVEVAVVMTGFWCQEKQIDAIFCRLISVAIPAARLVVCKWRSDQKTGQDAGSISNFRNR